MAGVTLDLWLLSSHRASPAGVTPDLWLLSSAYGCFPATERHWPLAGAKLYCYWYVTEPSVHERLSTIF